MTVPSASRRAFATAIGAAALGRATGARAQSKVTKIVVAFPPGGPVDFVARAIAEPLSREFGHQVIVENKPGANGAIAAMAVARAAPDGTTLWLTSVGAVAINPSLYDKLSYNPQTDLAPVSLVVNNVEVLVVHPSAPYNTGAEFVATARLRASRPLTMASSGTGSVPHLATELLRDAAGINLTHIPYKGAAPAITDVIAGHVDGFFGDIPGLIGHIKSGKLKAIALAAPKRHASLPDVRTFSEIGVQGVDSDNWYGLFTARGTPAGDIDKLNQAIRHAIQDSTLSMKLSASGATPAPSSPAELAALLQRDANKWGRIIRDKNIKAD